MQETLSTEPNITIADNTLDPQDWHEWLEAYAALRTREFIRLLESERNDITA